MAEGSNLLLNKQNIQGVNIRPERKRKRERKREREREIERERVREIERY